ncbi:MAG TPA: FISUMP domain-containing protein [Bacteroidales bacterium]|nr:FISUMP domain-containing protein [Bacteroidales bacterium]
MKELRLLIMFLGLTNLIFAQPNSWKAIPTNDFCITCNGIGLYWMYNQSGKINSATCKKTCKAYTYTIKFVNETGKEIKPSGTLYIRNNLKPPVCDMCDDSRGTMIDFSGSTAYLKPGYSKEMIYTLHIDTTINSTPPPPDNNQSLFSYKLIDNLISVPSFSDTLCTNCKGNVCFTYVFTFKPTGISSIFEAYAHIEIAGSARVIIDGVTLHYNLRQDLTGNYSNENSVTFSWKGNAGAPEMTPKYLGKVFIYMDPLTGKYSYDKKNIKIISKDVNCFFKTVNPDNYSGNSGTFIDSRDGHIYKWVRIGTQIWMAENLNYETSKSSCFQCQTYGREYSYEDAKKSCPSGWNLPSKSELEILIDYLGGTDAALPKLKSTKGWEICDNSAKTATNSSGFNALNSGGCRLVWWSSTIETTEHAYVMLTNLNWGNGIFISGGHKNNLFSVRCIKDKTSMTSGSNSPNEKNNNSPDNNESVNPNEISIELQIENAKKMALKNPTETNYINLGDLYFNNKQYKKAIDAYFEAGIDIRSNNTIVCNKIGLAHYNLEDYNSGLGWVCHALSIDPTFDKAKASLELIMKKYSEKINPVFSTMTDYRDGKTYKTVTLGTQTWMIENLNYEIKGSTCYDNSSDNCSKYGRLYTWNQANKACPKGWHLPSFEEWDQLNNYLCAQKQHGSGKIYFSSGIIYRKINTYMINLIDFYIDSDNDMNNCNRWWGSTSGSYSGSKVYFGLDVYRNNSQFQRSIIHKDFNNYVRCIMDN